jgi:hypothetical protein
LSTAAAHLGLVLYRGWGGLRKENGGGVDATFVCRTLIFGGYILVGTSINIVNMVAPNNRMSDLFAASCEPVHLFNRTSKHFLMLRSVGLAVVFTFGTQSVHHRYAYTSDLWG